MKIYNEDRTKEFNPEECEASLGYLTIESEIVHHEAVEGQEEQGHYEVIAEYENGGKDVKWVVDVPYIEGHEAYDEIIQFQVYHLYTEDELEIKDCEERIKYYQKLLSESDFKAIKYAEGLYTEEEYIPIKTERQIHRQTINALNERIWELKSKQTKETQNN